ncbi:protocadherin alpha-7-like [Puntigrus tetrazona]|uniref:protocadherin alpha-7-like n=1 Tax=Puntigrus tetrazona TaxID=1606681 RepID=UPI001C8B09CD|nr:protocadherin alpha-7-like [Puntigrus tetrazona]
MGDRKPRRKLERWCIILCLFFILCVELKVSAQIRYSIPEEVKEGAVVGNIAKDLGLDVGLLVDRRFRIVSGSKDAPFQVNLNNGALYVQNRIDREELCVDNNACQVNLKIAIENPLEIHYVGVEITDINDHAPAFPEKEQSLKIAENTLTGADFQLLAARDPDSGSNSLRTYKLSHNEHFELEVRDGGEDNKIPILKLQRALDRERRGDHHLALTALDGGNPPKSGVMNITITVLDINDNRPVFTKDAYTVTITENLPLGSLILQVNATDADLGLNGDVRYSFVSNLKKKVYDTFKIDSDTGEIRVIGDVDFEDTEIYRADVTASDSSESPMTTNCRVIIKVTDINDNKPEIEVTSLSNLVAEDSKPGTVISLISVSDRDSGANGKIVCSLSEGSLFELKPSFQENMYSLVTQKALDRELVTHFDILLTVTDLGQPPLSSVKTLSIEVSDVNDNKPEFPQNPLELFLFENNPPGASVFSVSAHDKDTNDNAVVSYHIIRGDGAKGDLSSFLNVNSETGAIHALKSFDFETMKTGQFQVLATDSGAPSLSSNVTVNVFILDQKSHQLLLACQNHLKSQTMAYPLEFFSSAPALTDESSVLLWWSSAPHWSLLTLPTLPCHPTLPALAALPTPRVSARCPALPLSSALHWTWPTSLALFCYTTHSWT